MGLDRNRDTPELALFGEIAPFEFPVAAGVHIFAGAFIVIDSAGNMKPGVAATGLIAVGRAEAEADNTDGDAGDIKCKARIGLFRWDNANSDALADADRGDTCYLYDDHTVAKTSGTGSRSVAGTVVSVDSAGVWVAGGFEFLLAPEAATGLSDADPQPVNNSATVETPGVSLSVSRADHAHAHGILTVGTLHSAATATVNGFQSFAHKNQLDQASPVYHARGVADSNVADLAAFVVAGFDGVTYVAGDVVLLANQTTAAECGLYLVGTVSGTAPLTRIVALPAAASYIKGSTVEVSEGTLWAGSTWKAMATGTCTVGTHDPKFYPRECRGILTLGSGTKTLGSAEGLWIFSVTRSTIHCTMNTPGGTLTLTTGGYGSNSAGRTAGKSGTAAAIVIARVAAGTIDTANNSTVDWLVTNW